MKTGCRFAMQSLLVASILAAGVTLVWFVLAAQLITVGETLCSEDKDFSETLLIRSDGVPLIKTGENNAANYRTLDGSPVLLLNEPTSIAVATSLNGPLPNHRYTVKPNWNNRILSIHQNLKLSSTALQGEQWYFIHDAMQPAHGYFVNCGSSPVYIGRNGASQSRPSPNEQFVMLDYVDEFNHPALLQSRLSYESCQLTPFGLIGGSDLPPLYLSTMDLLTDEGLMQINIVTRSVKMLRKEKAVSAAVMQHGFDMVTSSDGDPKLQVSKQAVLFRTQEQIRFLNFLTGEEQDCYTIPEELRNEDFLCYQLSPEEMLYRLEDKEQSDVAHNRQQLFWAQKDGVITRRATVALATGNQEHFLAENMLFTAVCPSSGVLAGFLVGDGGTGMGSNRKHIDYWTRIYNRFLEVWPAFLGTFLVGICLIPFCWRRQRKYGMSWTGLWIGFVLLFGLPAYFGYLLHRNWPARLACPHCGKLTPRDREMCIECGQPFPPPQRLGTEVFA